MRKTMTCAVGLGIVAVAITALAQARGQRAPAQPPNPDSQYRLGPDSLPQERVPKGEIRGPYTLPSQVYSGTQHTYWVYVPAQYDPAVPAALMVFQDGQAFKDEKGDMRAQNVMDNLIYRREIPVMIGVFINPGRRPDQPEPTPSNWGDRDTNRPTEYNSLDDKYARVITEELMPALAKDYNISKDPEMHGIGGSSSGAIAAFTVAWERPDHFRKVLSNVGSFVNLRGGHVYPEKVLAAEKKPIRVYLVRRPERQPRPPQGPVRRETRLVLPEREADEGPHAKGLRRELRVGDEQPRAKVRRRDPAGDDAVAVAGRSSINRPKGRGGARLPPAGGEEDEWDEWRTGRYLSAATASGNLYSVVMKRSEEWTQLEFAQGRCAGAL